MSWYLESRFTDKGKVFTQIYSPDEAEDLDTTPIKRQFKPMWKALKEARAYDDRLTEKDGICACYEVENMGFCKDGVTRWYWFTDVNGVPCYTFKR